MASTTATLGEFLQDKIAPAIRSQLVNEVPFLKSFEARDDVAWSGREVVQRIEVGRENGVYSTAEGGKAPDAGNIQIEALRIPVRFTHGQIEYTVQAMKAAKASASEAADLLQLKTKSMMNALRLHRLFGIWGDGRGVRARLNGDPGTTTTLTLDAPGGVAGPNHGSRFLNTGMYVVAVDPATGALRAGGTRKITAVAAAGTTVTIDAACDSAWADNDFIVRAYGNDASIAIGNTDWQHHPMGAAGMFDNGGTVNTYFGLSRTTFPVLSSTLIPNIGGLSADIIQRAIDVVTQVGNGNITEHWVHPDTRRAYLTLMEQDRRYTAGQLMDPNAGTKVSKGGYGRNSQLDFGSAPINIDPHCPYGEWFGLDMSCAKRYILEDGEWANETGEIFTEVSGQVDTYKATYRIYDNFAHLQPNQCFRLTGISSTFVMAHLI